MAERRPLTLRARMVLLAATAVTVILLLSGLLLSWGLRELLVRNHVEASRLRAHDVATLAAQDALPSSIPIGGDDEALVQVVAGGRVLAASPNIRDAGPLDLPVQRPGSEQIVTVERLPVGESGGFRVIATGTDTPEGPATVYVAVSLEEIAETVAAAGQIGLIGLPVLVLLLSGAMWVIVGRTLEPVEAIRDEAEVITGEDLDRRVPEPERLDEIGRLARTVNGMLSRLQRSAERQRRFVADAAHELRSPIASIRAQIETARGAPRPVDWEDVSSDVLNETLRMQQLTEQLLLLARVDADPAGLRAAAVDLDDLVDEVVDRRPADDRARVDRSGVRPAQVTGDRVLLEHLIQNLVDNALQHADRQIRVGLHCDDGTAVLTVDDDGPGIPSAQREAIFGRFTRLDAARDRHRGGAGLGLAIVSDIVKAHHGTVRAADSPLGGARLEVALPVS